MNPHQVLKVSKFSLSFTLSQATPTGALKPEMLKAVFEYFTIGWLLIHTG